MSICAVLFDRSGVSPDTDLKELREIAVRKAFGFTQEVYYFTQAESAPEGCRKIHYANARPFLDFLAQMPEGTTILLMNAYSAMLDVRSTQSMLKEHKDLAFDFTYAENLPDGLIPEAIESETAAFIRDTVPEGAPMFDKSIRELFESDLSSYDSNIFISQSRIIRFRVNFVPDSMNNALTMKALIRAEMTELSIEELEAKLAADPAVICQRPTFYEIELTTYRDESIDPPTGRSGEMEIATLQETLRQISEMSFQPVVMFGAYGEPFVHSRFEAVLDEVRKYPQIRFFFESRCLLTDFRLAQKVLECENVETIFDVSFALSESFAKWKKPCDGFAMPELLAVIEERIRGLNPANRVYIQFTRTTENEKELMRFFEKWKEYSDRIIIRKPDGFGGLTRQKRVVDLSPIRRFACLHLKHDMCIHSDAAVGYCKQDYEGKAAVGNVLKEGIDVCYKRLKSEYIKQCSEAYDGFSQCKDCDDWWIFNF